MGKCVIFCAGGFDALAQPIAPGDYIIAADGGLAHVQKLGITPHEILGDFDSLGYVPQNAAVFPVEKDDTDAMLAVRRGLALDYREFVLYGSLDGDRLDHTLANCQTLQFLADHGARGFLVGMHSIVTVIQQEALVFPPSAEGTISLFCMGKDASGVSLSGLKYPMTDGILTAGFPLGVSNRFIGSSARIAVKDGSLLALWDRKAGFPQRTE